MLGISGVEISGGDRGIVSMTMEWDVVRAQVASAGMRNSNVMAIAPTATISTIIGVTQSIEPTYKHLFVKSNLSGEFVQVNIKLVNELKERNLWNEDLLGPWIISASDPPTRTNSSTYGLPRILGPCHQGPKKCLKCLTVFKNRPQDKRAGTRRLQILGPPWGTL